MGWLVHSPVQPPEQIATTGRQDGDAGTSRAQARTAERDGLAGVGRPRSRSGRSAAAAHGDRRELRRYLSPRRRASSLAGAALPGRDRIRGRRPRGRRRRGGDRLQPRRPRGLRHTAARELRRGPQLPRTEAPASPGRSRRPADRSAPDEGNDRALPSAPDLRGPAGRHHPGACRRGRHGPDPLPVGEGAGCDGGRHRQHRGEGPRRRARPGATTRWCAAGRASWTSSAK